MVEEDLLPTLEASLLSQLFCLPTQLQSLAAYQTPSSCRKRYTVFLFISSHRTTNKTMVSGISTYKHIRTALYYIRTYVHACTHSIYKPGKCVAANGLISCAIYLRTKTSNKSGRFDYRGLRQLKLTVSADEGLLRTWLKCHDLFDLCATNIHIVQEINPFAISHVGTSLYSITCVAHAVILTCG